MRLLQKTPVHLWIYNHPFHSISDQVDFFISSFRQHGYPVSIGRQPSASCLNVVIENFSSQSRDVLVKFCTTYRKRVAVIMTEHLDFDDGQILIHGNPLWSDNDYMHPATQANRIRNLMDCLPHIRCFLVLGDLPELRNMSLMLPDIAVRSIPFPKLDTVQANDTQTPRQLTSELLFTGYMTNYRADILALLKSNSFSVACPQRFISRKNRDTMIRSAKLVLNIPQREKWRWLSLMRIIAALRCGRATVSLGTKDESRIAACCYQLDIANQGWPKELNEFVGNGASLYRDAYENYASMAKEYERSCSFPHDMLEFWAITDRMPKVGAL